MSQTHRDERVIITAPVGQDAEAMAAALNSEGFETQICQRLDECSRQMADSAGAVLLTEEALEAVQASRFLDVLKTQPPGLNCRSSFSPAGANRAVQNYWIWRQQPPGP
jgi:hypothetical protein